MTLSVSKDMLCLSLAIPHNNKRKQRQNFTISTFML